MRFAFAFLAAAGLTTAVHAGEVAPGDVEIVDGVVEQPLTDKPGDAETGIGAFTGRKAGNCLACHQVSSLLGAFQFHGEVGPSLDGVGDVYSAAELRARIVNAKSDNPDTIMPSFYREGGTNRSAEKFDGKTILSAQEVEDIVAYLLTLKE